MGEEEVEENKGEEEGEEEEVSEKMRRRKGQEWREVRDRGEGRKDFRSPAM